MSCTGHIFLEASHALLRSRLYCLRNRASLRFEAPSFNCIDKLIDFQVSITAQ